MPHPVTWTSAYRAEVRCRKLGRLKTILEPIKERFGGDRQPYAQELTTSYRREGLGSIDGASLLEAVAQLRAFLGIFHVLRRIQGASRFLRMAQPK